MGDAAGRGSGVRGWSVFLLRRLGLLALVLWFVATIAFAVTRVTGTPLYAAVGQQVTQEMIEARERLPFPAQPLALLLVGSLEALERAQGAGLVARAPHAAHAALSEGRLQPVRADPVAGRPRPHEGTIVWPA